MWVKPNVLPSAYHALWSNYKHADSKGMMVWHHGQKVGFGLRAGSHVTQYFAMHTDNNLLVVDEWSHIAAVYSGVPGTNRIYVNGINQDKSIAFGTEDTLPGGFGDSEEPLEVGAGYVFGTAHREYDGYLSNVSFYVDKALNSSEVLAEYEAGCPPDITEETLYGCWPLEGNFTDISEATLTVGNFTEVGSVPDEIDVTRPVAQIKQEDLDISAISATTALYYTIWQDPVHEAAHNYGARLGEITLHYTAAGGGGGAANIITASDTLVSNLTFSTVSGNAVIIDSRNKFDVRILSMNSAFDCTLRKDTSGGDIISYVPAGNTQLRASIPVADGTNVYLDGDSNATLTYSWTHGPTV
jgi:hypothetical protein